MRRYKYPHPKFSDFMGSIEVDIFLSLLFSIEMNMLLTIYVRLLSVLAIFF